MKSSVINAVSFFRNIYVLDEFAKLWLNLLFGKIVKCMVRKVGRESKLWRSLLYSLDPVVDTDFPHTRSATDFVRFPRRRRRRLRRARLLFVFYAHAQIVFRIFLPVARPELHSHHERRGTAWRNRKYWNKIIRVPIIKDQRKSMYCFRPIRLSDA